MLPNDFVRYGSINNRYFNNVPFRHFFSFLNGRKDFIRLTQTYSYMGIAVTNYNKSREPKPLTS